MRMAKIARITHPINWWANCVGQEVPMLEYHPSRKQVETVKVRVIRTEQTVFGDESYPVEGWIPIGCLDPLAKIGI